jgi:hypothetical protein
MTGDERVRHCAHCKKDVFNLSELSRDQAERLIIEKNGDLCARYFQRQDGTILLADCSVGIKQKRKTSVLAASAAMLLAGTGGIAGYLKLSHHHAKLERVPEPRMGAVAVVPHVPPPDVHEVKGDVAVEPTEEIRGQVIVTPPPDVVQGGISMDRDEEQLDQARARAKAQAELERQKAKAAEASAKTGKLKR